MLAGVRVRRGTLSARPRQNYAIAVLLVVVNSTNKAIYGDEFWFLSEILELTRIVTIAGNRSHRIPQTCVYTQYPLTGQWLAV